MRHLIKKIIRNIHGSFSLFLLEGDILNSVPGLNKHHAV